MPERIATLDEIQTGTGRQGQGRRHGGGVNVGTGFLHQVVREQAGAGDKGTAGADSFAQGPDQHRHVVFRQALGEHTAPALGAEHPDTMGVVDNQQSVVMAAEPGQFAQRRDIAIHTEHTVGDHQFVARGVRQHGVQRRHIAVGVATNAGTTENAAVNDRRVIETVGKNGVATTSERGNHAEIRHVTGRKKQRGLPAGKVCQPLFQAMVRVVMATHQVGSGAAKTGFRQCLP